MDNDAAEYVEDLGLIKKDPNGKWVISNKIYSEIIPRQLIITDNTLVNRLAPFQPIFYVDAKGGLKMEALMEAFRKFYRENGELCPGSYQEAVTQLVFMAFCQRIVNGGGTITREYALGTDVVDVHIEWPALNPIQKEIVELKRCRAKKDSLDTIVKDGVVQVIDQYLIRMQQNTGYLIVSRECLEDPKEEKAVTLDKLEQVTRTSAMRNGKEYTVHVYILPRIVKS